MANGKGVGFMSAGGFLLLAIILTVLFYWLGWIGAAGAGTAGLIAGIMKVFTTAIWALVLAAIAALFIKGRQLGVLFLLFWMALLVLAIIGGFVLAAIGPTIPIGTLIITL